MSGLLDPEGKTLIEVPSELYGAALVKGLFRHLRRPNDFDGRLTNIWGATAGRMPQERPLEELEAGLPWHKHHMGFDFHNLERAIEQHPELRVDERQFAPLNALGALASLDIYYSISRISA